MDQDSYLRPGRFIESDAPSIVAFARAAAGQRRGRDAAIALYYAVRDGIRYSPYRNFGRPESYSAKACLEQKLGFCVPKAALLAACARAIGLPARIGFADVRNHLSTPRLTELNGGDVFHWHAYTELLLDDGWVKATPAFDLALCERFGVKPLEFDGRTDSVFHPFDARNRRHMEYVNDRGQFADVPFDAIIATLRQTSPRLLTDEPLSHNPVM